MALLKPIDQATSEDSPRFFTPPLWRQRREHIFEILQKHKVSSAIDFGCGEGSVISFLISCNDEPPIVKLAGLDISSEAVEECSIRCKPWQTDFDNLRERPLSVEIFQGSVAQPSRQLLGYDALFSSEVIEHLFPEALELYPQVIFGVYQIPLVIISTPNAEFNVLFPQLNYMKPNSIFRDDDHKFEWTRKEFEAWCQSNAERYGYSVEYSGVGSTPKMEDRHLGFCTQFAVFKKKESLLAITAEFNDHKLVASYDFPYFDEQVNDSDRIDCLLEYAKYISLSAISSGGYPIFQISDFWKSLKIRQRFRTQELFLEFLNSPSRNQKLLFIQGDDLFSIHKELNNSEGAYGDNWPSY